MRKHQALARVSLLNQQEVLCINRKKLAEPSETYALALYNFLFQTLVAKYIAHKKHKLPVEKETQIPHIVRKKVKQHISKDLPVIVQHLLLHEMQVLQGLYLRKLLPCAPLSAEISRLEPILEEHSAEKETECDHQVGRQLPPKKTSYIRGR